MKYLFAFILIAITTLSSFAQNTLKRYQYDEFIYGVTAPEVENVEDLAAYYNISVGSIDTFNQRMFQTDLSFEFKKVIYLPAGTLLKNPNVAFIETDRLYEIATINDLQSDSLNVNLFGFFPIENKLVVDLLDFSIPNITGLIICTTPISSESKKSIPDKICNSDCANPLYKVNIAKGYTAYVTDYILYRDSYQRYLHLFYYNDLVAKILIGEQQMETQNQRESKPIFDDFNDDGMIDILVHTKHYQNYELQNHSFKLYILKDGTYVETNILDNKKIRNRIKGKV